MSPLSKTISKAFLRALKRLSAGATTLGKANMALYEHVFMARQDVSPQQVETLVEQFKTLLEENGGSVGKIETWGLRTLTYRINKNRKAHYTLMNIDAPHAAVAEMERQMGLNEDVLRFLTLRVEKHEEEQSAMMQKRDRDDRRRRERGDRPGGDRPDRGDRAPRRQENEASSAESN